jgi:uncharacterized protein (DUF1684 family)
VDRHRIDAPRIAMTAWVAGDGSLADRLTLADWRRRIAALYVEVRAMAASDPAVALAHWRAVRERMFREHPQSPVPVTDRETFRASHFEHDPRLRIRARVEAVGGAEAAPAGAAGAGVPGVSAGAGVPGVSAGAGMPGVSAGAGEPGTTGVGQPALASAGLVSLPNSGDDAPVFRNVGLVRLALPDGERRLSVFWVTGYAGGLFIPFRDATNGRETYGAGRYLVDAAKSHDLGADEETGELILDFNFATQPSCAFDPKWACPLAPPENRLDLEVRAGERLA